VKTEAYPCGHHLRIIPSLFAEIETPLTDSHGIGSEAETRVAPSRATGKARSQGFVSRVARSKPDAKGELGQPGCLAGAATPEGIETAAGQVTENLLEPFPHPCGP